MPSLLEISEIFWEQHSPKGSDESPLSREDILLTVRSEYAHQMWLKSKAERRNEGAFILPANILDEKEIEVTDNKADVSSLEFLSGLDNDQWLVNIGGFNCECLYIKSNYNLSQLLCDDDGIGDARTYFLIGKTIHFPKGVHKNKLPIIYATNGSTVEEETEIDESVGAIIRSRLIDIYIGKTGAENVTNNTNSNT